MRTKLTVVTALAGTLLATCLVSGSAQATSVPVLKGDATPGIVTLVGRGGGRGGVGRGVGVVGVGRHYGGVGVRRHYGGVGAALRPWCPALRCRCWAGVTMADATALAHITIGMAWLASTPAGTRT